MSKLALLGGTPVVNVPAPHFTWPPIGIEDIEAAVKQLETGIVSVYGRSGVIKEFEDEFAAYHGMRYAIATNSGTTSLHSAFFGCGIGPGDEVLAPTYTFLATVTPILHVNAVPVLVDAEPETGNMDPDDLLRKITSRTKAVVITHMWGHPCEMDRICQIVQEHGLSLIEDCSHAHGATYKNQLVGTFGDVSCFSLQGNKIVSAGEGGILLTNNTEIYERATLLGHFRDRSEQCVHSDFYKQFAKTGYGLKYRMHTLAAALARVSFRHLDERIELRRRNLDCFSELIRDVPGIQPPITRPYVTRGAYYGYKPLYQAHELDELPLSVYLSALQAEGLDISKPGSPPLHQLPLFQTVNEGMYPNGWPRRGSHVLREVTHKEGDFPVAEDYYSKALSVPTFTSPDDRYLVELYAEAFHKVAQCKDELLSFAESSVR